MEFSYSRTENFEMEKLYSDTGYFKKTVEINRRGSVVVRQETPQPTFFIAVLRLQAGVGQESESSTDWAKTLKQHVAQRRSLPTTIESFDEENLDENNEVIF